MTTTHIEIHPDRSALVARSHVLVKERIQSAVTERGECSIVLAGGSTPKPLYEALAQEDLPWSKLHIFWGDERYVSLDHPDSNAAMAKAALLDKVAIPAEQIHMMPTYHDDPADAAHEYEQSLKQAFGTEQPIFDIVLLGMGDDGHTLSLFPHTAAVNVSDRLVTIGQKGDDPRVTLTAPLVNHSRCVIFLVSGANKQTALTQVLAADADDNTFPARKIQPQGELWWLVDAAAGEPIKTQPNVQIC
jgi:6-phosphogluconolactonase